jgi:hypothetical protein
MRDLQLEEISIDGNDHPDYQYQCTDGEVEVDSDEEEDDVEDFGDEEDSDDDDTDEDDVDDGEPE